MVPARPALKGGEMKKKAFKGRREIWGGPKKGFADECKEEKGER